MLPVRFTARRRRVGVTNRRTMPIAGEIGASPHLPAGGLTGEQDGRRPDDPRPDHRRAAAVRLPSAAEAARSAAAGMLTDTDLTRA